jgi:hypothetical protein
VKRLCSSRGHPIPRARRAAFFLNALRTAKDAAFSKQLKCQRMHGKIASRQFPQKNQAANRRLAGTGRIIL